MVDVHVLITLLWWLGRLGWPQYGNIKCSISKFRQIYTFYFIFDTFLSSASLVVCQSDGHWWMFSTDSSTFAGNKKRHLNSLKKKGQNTIMWRGGVRLLLPVPFRYDNVSPFWSNVRENDSIYGIFVLWRAVIPHLNSVDNSKVILKSEIEMWNMITIEFLKRTKIYIIFLIKNNYLIIIQIYYI